MKNKKVLIVIGTIILITLLVLSSVIKPKDKTQEEVIDEEVNSILETADKESEKVKDSEKRDFIYIDTNKFLEDYSSEDANIVLIASSTCHYCQIAVPILQNIAYKYDLTIEYLSTDNLTDDEKVTIIDADEYFSNGVGTPLLLILGNNGIIGKVEGLTDSQHYIDFFKNNNLIK